MINRFPLFPPPQSSTISIPAICNEAFLLHTHSWELFLPQINFLFLIKKVSPVFTLLYQALLPLVSFSPPLKNKSVLLIHSPFLIWTLSLSTLPQASVIPSWWLSCCHVASSPGHHSNRPMSTKRLCTRSLMSVLSCELCVFFFTCCHETITLYEGYHW